MLALKWSVTRDTILHNIIKNITAGIVFNNPNVIFPGSRIQRYVSHIPSVDQASSSCRRMHDAPHCFSTFFSKQRFITSCTWLKLAKNSKWKTVVALSKQSLCLYFDSLWILIFDLPHKPRQQGHQSLSCLITCTDSFFGQDMVHYLDLCLITDGRAIRISSN